MLPSYQQLAADYDAAKALGSPLIKSNGMLVLDHLDEFRFMLIGFQFPIATGNEAAEVSYAGGLQAAVPSTPKTLFQSSLMVVETEEGAAQDLAELIVSMGKVDGWAYYGRPDNYTRRFKLKDMVITFEGGPEYEAESRSTTTQVTGNMQYHYFGQNESLGGGVSSPKGRVGGLAGLQKQLSKAQQKLAALRALTGR